MPAGASIPYANDAYCIFPKFPKKLYIPLFSFFFYSVSITSLHGTAPEYLRDCCIGTHSSASGVYRPTHRRRLVINIGGQTFGSQILGDKKS